MKNEIFSKLCLIYKKYVSGDQPNKNSQLCIIWPTDDPPDILEGTLQHEDIEKIFDVNISEDEAVGMFDMNLKEASEFIEKIIDSKISKK